MGLFFSFWGIEKKYFVQHEKQRKQKVQGVALWMMDGHDGIQLTPNLPICFKLSEGFSQIWYGPI